MPETYHRQEFGWIRDDREIFLERGAPMQNTGNPAWLIWVRALDSEIDISEVGMAFDRRTGSPARKLSELTYHPEDGDVYYLHQGDEGWFADAKLAAIHHLERRDALR